MHTHSKKNKKSPMKPVRNVSSLASQNATRNDKSSTSIAVPNDSHAVVVPPAASIPATRILNVNTMVKESQQAVPFIKADLVGSYETELQAFIESLKAEAILAPVGGRQIYIPSNPAALRKLFEDSKLESNEKGAEVISVRNVSSSTSQNVARTEKSTSSIDVQGATYAAAVCSNQLERKNLNGESVVQKSQQPVTFQKADLAGKVNLQAVPALSAGQNQEPDLVKGVQNVASWLDISNNNRVLNDGVAKLHEDTSGLSTFGVDLEDDDVFEEEEEKRCLVGLFSGIFPSDNQIERMVDKWKHFCRFHFHNSGWIIFEFEDEQAALDVLAAAPYFAGNKPISLKQMPKLFNFSLVACSRAPVWIQLPNLPLRCWKKESLSKICSFVGVPISTDQITNRKASKSFARCLVEVDLTRRLPGSMLVTSLGVTFKQVILYENLPDFCENCKRIGHLSDACKSNSDAGCPTLYIPAPKMTNNFTTFTNKNARRRNNRRNNKQAVVVASLSPMVAASPTTNDLTASSIPDATSAPKRDNIFSNEASLESASLLKGGNRFLALDGAVDHDSVPDQYAGNKMRNKLNSGIIVIEASSSADSRIESPPGHIP